MLMLEVMVEPYQLFPFNHSHCGVEGVEVSYWSLLPSLPSWLRCFCPCSPKEGKARKEPHVLPISGINRTGYG
jgi:hypothetical protein